MPPRTNKTITPQKTSRRFVSVVLLLAVVAIGIALTQRQALYDWWRLHGYTPPADIAALAQDDQFTLSATHVFYVNHPQVEDKAAFAQSCPNGDKETAVLGCYVPPQMGIYVLSVTDARLAGIEQVTAAHEMLHAEYDRLDAKTKQQVDGWLQDYAQNGLHDSVIQQQLDSYRKTEPTQLVNEMHSIFGTEVTNLPANLENYYKRYFNDRAKITSYYQTYEAEFSSRQNQIKADDAQLAAWKAEIQSLESDIANKAASLNHERAQLEQERGSGNTAAFNAGVAAFNAQVDAYNAEVAQVRGLVSRYNQLVAQRNAIVLEEQQLVQDISSQASPIGSQ